MRQVQRLAPRARTPTPRPGRPTRQRGHPSGAGWNAWTPPLTPGRARPSTPTAKGGDPALMSTLRRLAARLLLIAAPAALLLLETAGNRISP
jgi:hypothetical protein